MARRLVYGSFVASFESRKQILYAAEQHNSNALFRVLDPSLPWWTERDSWARWTSTSSGRKESTTTLNLTASSQFSLARINPEAESPESSSTVSLSQAIQDLASDPNGESSKKRVSI